MVFKLIVRKKHFYLTLDDIIVSNCEYYTLNKEIHKDDLLYKTLGVDTIYIHDFITKKIHRRKGYGSVFLEKIFQYVHTELNIDTIALSVLNNNEPAIKLYNKLNFVVVENIVRNKETFKVIHFKDLVYESLYGIIMVKKI